MIPALASLLAFSMVFVEQEIPGLYVGRPNPLNGAVAGNFRNHDLDNDGFEDLLLPDRVLLQRGGVFPPALAVPLPRAGEGPRYEVFDGTLYVRLPELLEQYRLSGVNWEPVLQQQIAWPDLAPPTRSGDAQESPPTPGRWTRYLYDLDADGVPEILVADTTGFLLYVYEADAYRRTTALEVFPAEWPIIATKTPLWPSARRRLQYPSVRRSFWAFMADATVSVTTSTMDEDGLALHSVSRYPLAAARPFSVVQDRVSVETSRPLPPFLQPCRLNGDTTIDFAGTRSYAIEHVLVPQRIVETVVTTDGGRTLQSFRTKAFQPLSSFVDFDGDGDLDLVAESSGLFEGGLHDFLTRLVSRRSVRHEIAIHRQDANGRFSDSLSARHAVTIAFDRPLYRNSPGFLAYQYGELVNLTGDLDGDGHKDLVVQTQPDQISVFLNEAGRFPSKPTQTVSCSTGARFAVADIDRDGRSDLVVSGELDRAAGQAPLAIVFFSRESAQ